MGVPLAKLIPRELRADPELVMLASPRSLAAERYRRLRTTLVNQHPSDLQVIAVTSPSPEEGKTTVSLNLSLAFAASGERTLLVDADVRRPTVGSFVDPTPELGLSEALSGQAGVEHAVLTLQNSTLEVLPAGQPSRDPAELLASDEARKLLKSLRHGYDRILIDTPPILPFTDADDLGALSDGVLMVIRAGKTLASSYRQAVQSVTSTRVLGTVLNDATRTLADLGRYRNEEYYAEYYRRDRNK